MEALESSIESVKSQQPVLAAYTDYRLYLNDFYLYRRSNEGSSRRPYSYAHFSTAADIKSPNYLKLIIDGKRNLSAEMIAKFAKALRLGKDEADEFRALVFYGQAVDPLEKNQFLKDLSQIRAKRDLASGKIDQKTWEKVPNWVTWVVYSMLDQKDVKFEVEELHKLFRSSVKPEQLKVALQSLFDSKQIEIDPQTGALKKNRAMVESAEDVPVELVRKLQTELIYLGLESLFRDSPKDREFGAFTLALTKEEFERVRFELRKMRKAIQKDIMMKREFSKGERVYQLNMQLFPVTNSADPTQNSKTGK
jgi:uncharacterized protein (TIGR02147 family)